MRKNAKKTKKEKAMSYSLKVPCGECIKEPECVDAQVVAGAIGAIHALWKKGHKGGGTIEIQCSNIDKAPAPDTEAEQKPE